MRYTETISISWHTFAGEKPRPHKDIVVKRYGANTLFAPKDIIHAEDVPQALTGYAPYDEWAYADEIKTIKSDGSILRDDVYSKTYSRYCRRMEKWHSLAKQYRSKM